MNTHIFIITTLCISALHAQWSEDLTKSSQPPYKDLSPEKLEYQLSWNGTINSGNLVFELGVKDARYPKAFIGHIYGRSTGAANALFPYRFTFTSFSHPGSYRPIVFVADEIDNKEQVKTKNNYKAPGVIHEATTKVFKKKTEETEKHSFSVSQAHDPLTAMLAVRAQPLKNGDTVRLCLHPFSSPYYAQIKVLGREPHLGTNCIKLDVAMQKIDLKSRQLKNYKKLKKATLWISDDAQRIPIELRTEVFIGDVRAVLTKRSPLK